MPDDATTFMTLMMTHNYTTFVAVLMLIGGLLLLVGRFVPIGLVLLGPILVNILLFHVLFKVPGIAVGLVCTVLEVFLIWVYRVSFRGLFAAGRLAGFLRRCTSMKLTTWNCARGFERKKAFVFADEPDIAVIQECSKKSTESHSFNGYDAAWLGVNPNMGPGVFL